MNTLALLLTLFLCWGLPRVSESASQSHTVNRDGVVYAAAPREQGAYAVGAVGGRYNYGYNTGDDTRIAKVEVRQPDGSIVGSYRYYDPNGKQVVRSYVADNGGFRVLGNDLPISPDTPASKVHGAQAFTGAVEGTDEYAIPPPLGSGASSQTHNYQLQQQQSQQQLQQEQLVQQSQKQQQLQEQLVQQQQEVYLRQQQQLEEQRRQLLLQQEKLEALQRELELQQLKIQQQLQTQQPQYKPPQQQQQHYQTSYRPPQQQHYQSSLQQGFPREKNHLTGGTTSPYYVFDHKINYDFPAGFAYLGMPTLVSSPPRNTGYPSQGYIIGQAR